MRDDWARKCHMFAVAARKFTESMLLCGQWRVSPGG